MPSAGKGKLCKVPKCSGVYIAKGLCNKHYLAQPHRRAYRKVHYYSNKEWENSRNNKYYASNKKRFKKVRAAYYRRRRGDFAKRTRLYLKMRVQAIPKWADLEAINNFYIKCPKGYHVDHIIPITSKYVCGLHVLDNLQYLTRHENCFKSNKHDGTYANKTWRLQFRKQYGKINKTRKA